MQEQHDVEAPFLSHDNEEDSSDTLLTKRLSSALIQSRRWLKRASSSFAVRKAVRVDLSSTAEAGPPTPTTRKHERRHQAPACAMPHSRQNELQEETYSSALAGN